MPPLPHTRRADPTEEPRPADASHGRLLEGARDDVPQAAAPAQPRGLVVARIAGARVCAKAAITRLVTAFYVLVAKGVMCCVVLFVCLCVCVCVLFLVHSTWSFLFLLLPPPLFR